MHRSPSRRLAPAAALLAAVASCAGPPPAPAPRPAAGPPPVAEPVPAFAPSLVRLQPDEAMRLARAARDSVTVRLADGFRLDLWAPEGLVADPIAIHLDSLGRAFVTGTARTNRAEIDIRGHRDWMVESITFRDVEDKRRFYLRELDPSRSARNAWLDDYNGDGSRDWRDLTVHRESVYRLEDTNGDGMADLSQLVLRDFGDVIDDVAHGILSHNGDLILTASPDIWRIRDTNGDGVADTKESLAHGFGVHIGFGGHGLSGPIIGPDGRLYWKMGDLGFNIETRDGRRVQNTHSGAILRAEPDGSNLEIFASGLRNPQEFAFDEYGNMIAADNDGDHQGETERLVYITEGSDAGWRINWQFGKYVDPDNNAYKVWMDEALYRPRWEGQAAYITPPIAAYASGPSGFLYNPGTALSEAWKDHFFVTVFTGSAGNARIHGFQLREQGAGFELAGDRELVRGILSPGMEWGPDGAIYITDWIQGWAPKERGRVWRFDVAAGADTAARAETRALIAAPFTSLTVARLAELLRHEDMRVRQKAQFGLVDRGAERELLAAARQRDHQLARVHALWGIGQLARRDPRHARSLPAFLTDADPEIRAQAAKLLGDLRHAPAAEELVPLLRDAQPRVRFFAAEALGKLRHAAAIPAIVRMLEENQDADLQLRHAGALALARIGDSAPVVALSTHPSRAVRIAAVVALRRMRDPGVARFLRDSDDWIVTEAARAINDDESIEGALPELAAVLEETRFRGQPLLRRAINANLRVGSPEAARRVAAFALAAPSDTLAIEALSALGVWPKPSILDRVDGYPRQAVTRDSAAARAALAAIVDPVLSRGAPAVQVALAEAAGRLRLTGAVPALFAKVGSGPTPEVRIAALRALQAIGDPRAAEAVRTALQDTESTVRMAALGVIPGLNLPEATTVELLSSMVERGSVAEQQAALASLGQLQGTTARQALTQLVDRLDRGGVPADIQLDVTEAARATGDPMLVARLDRLQAQRATAAPLVAYGDALRGGNAPAGQRVVINHPAAQCTRCHVVAGTGTGTNVGPDLRGVGSRLTREQLLEALVAPNARIAPGYGPVSAMPPMGGVLTRRELRDVVEYLSTLR